MSDDPSSTSFTERQAFRQPWIWALLLGTTAPVVLVPAWGAFQQVVLDVPFGTRPMSDGALIATAIGSAAFAALLLGGMWRLVLVTEVRADRLHARLWPFPAWNIPYEQIESAEARTYRPIREYGGWGWRFGPSGRALNVSGTEGLQLVLSDGSKRLIGSQRAAELAAAVAERRGARAAGPSA